MANGNSGMMEQFYKIAKHCSKMTDRISIMADKIIKWPSSIAKCLTESSRMAGKTIK
jgi:hypothetical protein